MTTEFLTINLASFPNFIVMEFPNSGQISLNFCRSFKGATRLGATRPATLREKWHSERVSERAFEKPLKTSQNL